MSGSNAWAESPASLSGPGPLTSNTNRPASWLDSELRWLEREVRHGD